MRFVNELQRYRSTAFKDMRFPDFIIGGAPKCGTTSLHFILKQNADVGMPDGEVLYFDADDPVTHPDFLHARDGALEWFDPRRSDAGNVAWYAGRFAPYRDCKRIGEDSPTYIFSDVAAHRIKALLPDVKLVFLLRDPVKRAYSQYWHMLGAARATFDFETAIGRAPSITLGSTYFRHLKHFLDIFGPDQVRILLFEDFLSDQQGFLDGVTDYLGISRMEIEQTETWFNKSVYPRYPMLKAQLNRVGKIVVGQRYRNHMGKRTGLRERLRNKSHYYWFEYANHILPTAPKAPPMKPGTARYLRQHLSERNRGLSELLGRDLGEVWPGFDG